MKIAELAWNPSETSDSYDDDLLLEIQPACVAILIRGRNAWHSTWVRHYFKHAQLYTDVASAKQGAEDRRGNGNVFYINEAPALVLVGSVSCVVVCDAHPDDPFANYRGLGAVRHESKYGAFLTGLFPGISVRDSVRTFQHDSDHWDGPRPSEHSLRTGRLASRRDVLPVGPTFTSISSFAQGSRYPLGWRTKEPRYSQEGVHKVAQGWKLLVDNVACRDGNEDVTSRFLAHRTNVLNGLPLSEWQEARRRAMADAELNAKRAGERWWAAMLRVAELESLVHEAERELDEAREDRLHPASTAAGIRAQRERYGHATADLDAVRMLAVQAEGEASAARASLISASSSGP